MVKNQTFTTFDVVTVISLVIGIMSLSGAVIASFALDSSPIEARLTTEKLARQLLMGGLENLESERKGRKFASLNLDQRLELLGSGGVLSKDPWGEPYSYRIGTDTRGRKVAVVWSNGPNRKKDSPDFIAEGVDLNGIHFSNDDIGSVIRRD